MVMIEMASRALTNRFARDATAESHRRHHPLAGLAHLFPVQSISVRYQVQVATPILAPARAPSASSGS